MNDKESMPLWLASLLLVAFESKDCRQIQVLNQFWFFYQKEEISPQGEKKTIT